MALGSRLWRCACGNCTQGCKSPCNGGVKMDLGRDFNRKVMRK